MGPVGGGDGPAIGEPCQLAIRPVSGSWLPPEGGRSMIAEGGRQGGGRARVSALGK
jgi:hypothetical protein